MKIGLYGGIANNMYVFAQALIRQQIETVFIRDRADRFVFSQPVWEDNAWTLPYAEITETSNWSWEQWTQVEKSLGWSSPLWLKDPFNFEKSSLVNESFFSSYVDNYLTYRALKTNAYWSTVIEIMRSVDYLLVCGIEGAILALLSKKPFIILPHGGDIRTAVGLHPPMSKNPRIWLAYWKQQRFLKLAYQKAICIATHDPLGIGGHVGDVLSTSIGQKLRKLPIPFQIRPRPPKEKRVQILKDLLAQFNLELPDTPYIGFIPSRVDFYWKGHDKILQAYHESDSQDSISLIFSGWGQDYQKAKDFVIKNQLEKQIIFLPCSVSKPMLYDFFLASDFVIDQLLMGTYGTSAIEAMSCGCPVMMWINEDAFRKQQWQVPPVINVKSHSDIYSAFKKLVNDHEFLSEVSNLANDWIADTHNDQTAVDLLLNYLTTA